MTIGQRNAANPHARLGALAACLRAGSIDAAERVQLADTLARVAAGADANTALGVRRRPGQRLWSTQQAFDARDQLLREGAERFLSGLSMSEQARHLSAEMTRYHAAGWQYERAAPTCPARHRGRLSELLWLALRQHDHPLSARRVREILAAS